MWDLAKLLYKEYEYHTHQRIRKNQMHIIQRFHIIAVFCYHGVPSDIPYRYIFEWVYGKYYKLIQTVKKAYAYRRSSIL